MSSTPSSHKPRKKRKDMLPFATATNHDLVIHDEETNAAKPLFPLVAFLWPGRGTTSQWVILPLILMVVGLFRWAIGFWGYSGFNIPPMHGDFEAQRHWMEITQHLPISLWYFYDLQYWGLDYPPLTAYHSWLCGKIGSMVDQAWFVLDQSRGLETMDLKTFMRATVVVSEYLTYIPAVVLFQRHFGRMNGLNATSSAIALVAILMQPATILIDHGHFQYNTVMLGFVVAAISSFLTNHVVLGSVFFVAALGFKQMALYYAPVVFTYLLGSSLTPRIRLGRLFLVAVTTAAAFLGLFAPLLLGSAFETYYGSISADMQLSELSPPSLLTDLSSTLGVGQPPKSSLLYTTILQLSQSIHRIFPFARGLFEDKVANFWCLLNHTVIKLSKLPTSIPLPRLALYFTLMSILPSCLVTCAVPRKSILIPALASCSWGFFLFSFQVHEKSVLLPLLPMTLMLGSNDGLTKVTRAWVGWANVLGTWTMYPLLKRDELRTPYAVLLLLWTYLLGLPPTSLSAYSSDHHATQPQKDTPAPASLTIFTKIIHLAFYLAMATWHVLEATVSPPPGMPDLFIVVNVIVGSVGFGICYMWCTWKMVEGTGILDLYFNYRRSQEEEKARSRKSATPEPLKVNGAGGKKSQQQQQPHHHHQQHKKK